MPYLSGATAVLGTGDGVELALDPGHWGITNTPAAATQATATKAAVAGMRHIAKVISVGIAAGANAQTPLQVVVRDGLTGAGTIIWSKFVSAPVNQSVTIDISSLSIVGSVNTAMTVEFTGVGVAASQQTVNLYGVDVTQ